MYNIMYIELIVLHVCVYPWNVSENLVLFLCVCLFVFFSASLRGLALNIDERDSKQDFR